MEAWFLSPALGLSLSVLLLGVPGLLRAAGTPSNRSEGAGTTGGWSPQTAARAETSSWEYTNVTSASSESLSPSQRNLLLTHTEGAETAATLEREMTTRSLDTAGSSTEPLTSTGVHTSSSQVWTDLLQTDAMPVVTPAVTLTVTPSAKMEDASSPRDSLEGATGHTSAVFSQPDARSEGSYMSTTVSRAGERTLLSVTSNGSTYSVFTEDSTSHRPPPSAWSYPAVRRVETEDYTISAPSTLPDSRDTTEPHVTLSFTSESGSPEESTGTRTSSGVLNFTTLDSISTSGSSSSSSSSSSWSSSSGSSSSSSWSSSSGSSWSSSSGSSWSSSSGSTSDLTSDSTPDTTSNAFPDTTSNSTPDSTLTLKVTTSNTDRSEASSSSTPPVISPAGAPTEPYRSYSSSIGFSTESSLATLNPRTVDTTFQTVADVDLPLTTSIPVVSSSTTDLDRPQTAVLTEVYPTTVTPTQRSQTTEEETFAPTPPSTTAPATTTIPLSPATSTSSFKSTTEAGVPQTASSTSAASLTPQTSTVTPAVFPSPTPQLEPVTSNPTTSPTLMVEPSTIPPGVTTVSGQRTTASATWTPTTTPSTAGTLTTTSRAVTTTPREVRLTKATPPPGNLCVSNPCRNGGMCLSYRGNEFTCRCQQAWTGPTCSQDVDECETDPCPVGSRCVNTRGSFSCECPLGLDLEDGRSCTRAKTFLGTFSVNRLSHDQVFFKSAAMHELQREILLLLNASLSVTRGYSRSTLSKKQVDGVHILAISMFSISTDVTSAEVFNSIQMSLRNCSSSVPHCRMVLQHQLTYQAESLCLAQKMQCDTERSTCTDVSGTASCQCLHGYYKHNPEDLSCLECGDGFKLENGTCVQCMFGFGGFNCGNFYKLIAVVVSPAGGALLLILIIALTVTCCKKDKNDINKIIFKSGDMQMSPYTDFPKSNRISMEWGRETIEMQENGSTKNLLQMTDIYYSPALRNSDLERNGLYPFTGLPGSRHSCIYPATWNPSFISDDSRRRDYF
ncbi:protein HEG [Synchiropus splendidus]|uniref:protein HEG n=1 Tax=Synchiropus splendidus TaxID=270530 RepID=UPI00237ED072|nr:protein HEG [Synchiropus splendidus]